MKLLAQHGFNDGIKIRTGLEKNFIEGVIFSPKDIKPENLSKKLKEFSNDFPDKNYFFDPQYYVSVLGNDPNINIGKLIEYNNYFEFNRKSNLERENNIIEILNKSLEYQIQFKELSSIISPNIMISNRLDSRDAVISKNFIRLAQECYSNLKDTRPLYVTLALSREALMNINELEEFLNDITVLDHAPNGFYILISARNNEARSDIFNSRVIAGWLLLNYSFKVNGFKVMNGYSDIISPFLGAVGADFGSTGWWSNLRTFSIDRFTPNSTGGRIPIQRYLSKVLLNRITHFEFNSWKKSFPQIVNNLSTDDQYVNEPERALEVLQSWESITSLINDLSSNNLNKNLTNCIEALKDAKKVYELLNIFSIDQKSNSEHIEPLIEGLNNFMQIAEISLY